MKNIVEFNNQKIELIKNKGSYWITSNQLAIALGYSRTDIVGKLYNAHKDETTDKMSDTNELVLPGNLRSITRIFSLRGCRMMGFFARTKIAVEFKKWVLDLIEQYEAQNPQIEVQSYTRSLPSGKKEIVLSEKAKAEISNILKSKRLRFWQSLLLVAMICLCSCTTTNYNNCLHFPGKERKSLRN